MDFDRGRIPTTEEGDTTTPILDGGTDAESDADDSPENFAPNAVDDGQNGEYTTHAGVLLTVAPADGVLQNDADPDGDPLVAELQEPPATGYLNLASDGSFTYLSDAASKPAPDDHALLTFTYRASDGELSSPATAHITVLGDDTAIPLAADDSYMFSEDDILTVSTNTGVGHNDTPTTADETLTFALFSPPEPSNFGALDFHEDGTFTFTPSDDAQALSAGESQQVTFVYTASNGERADGATVTLTILGKNDAPRIAGDTGITASNTVWVTPAGTLLAGVSDPEGGPITIVSSTSATALGGEVTVSAEGGFTYTPPQGVTETEDSFVFTASDGDNNTEGQFTVAIRGPLIWYVDNSYQGASDGRSHKPFTTLDDAQATAEAIAETNPNTVHVLRVEAGNAPYGGIELFARQRLLGAGVALEVELGDASYTLEGAGPAPVLQAPGDAVQLADHTEVAGLELIAGVHGIQSTGVDDLHLHDLYIHDTGERGVSLDGPLVSLQIERITTENTGTSGIAIGGCTGPAVLEEVSVINPHRNDNAPAGSGGVPEVYGISLRYNADVTIRGGQVVFDEPNRNTAIHALHTAQLVLESYTSLATADAEAVTSPLRIAGVGLGQERGSAAPAIQVEYSTSVTLNQVHIVSQQRPSQVASTDSVGAVTLIDPLGQVQVSHCVFGPPDPSALDSDPFEGHGVHISQTAGSQALHVLVEDNTFTPTVADGLIDAIKLDYTGGSNGNLVAQLNNNQIGVASRLFALTLAGTTGSPQAQVLVESLSGVALGSAAISLTSSGRIDTAVSMDNMNLDGSQGQCSKGIEAILEGEALDLSVRNSRIRRFGNQGVDVISRGESLRLFLGNNDLADENWAASGTNAAGVQLVAEAQLSNVGNANRGQLDAVLEDNTIDWFQHAVLVLRADTPADLCFDARNNDCNATDIYLGGTGVTDIAISQQDKEALSADNGGANVLVDGVFSATNVSCEQADEVDF